MTVEALAGAIRQVESGGNYRAIGIQTRYGRATGAYQFLTGTWGGYAGYKNASDAPPEIQDRKALESMRAMYAEFRRRAPRLSETEVFRLIAIAWHAGMGTALKAMKTGTAGTSDGLISTDSYAARVLKQMGVGDPVRGQALRAAQTTGAEPEEAPEPEIPPEEYQAELASQLSSIFGMDGPLGPGFAEPLQLEDTEMEG